MAFDSQTRNKLQRMVGACRRLLADEFDDQLQGLYGIYAQDGRVLDLKKLTNLDDDHHQTATLLRARIDHLTSGMVSEKQPLAEAVRRVRREQAFTLLNRFTALRMAEERGFVQECVGQGLKSKGFQVFETVARSGLGGAYERYVTFIYGMFDELSLDLGVLFDRWSPFGLLFPREPALLKFFELLSDPELKPLWKEDETIGWIYQYFNDETERKKMREESSAPRNSRELAVRNQFFTPRYVVEFLTDNTLGRIWYEMTQGETRLTEQCRYLVRRPNEIFLKPGENPPAVGSSRDHEAQTFSAKAGQSLPTSADTITQEDLLKQPVFTPHRPLKDPRTILMLDPACGSMHFGLYAFDLFEIIYEEAWELEEKVGAEALNRPPGMKSLHDAYVSMDAFLKDVPRLIIEHNLHGIDIDPRCAQIAGLSLWLRAQKAWQRLGLKPSERPVIKRSNIVCAEPMPGEKELLREFVEREFSAEERGVFLRLLEAIFDKMQLAGEAGSLLKIEEEIRTVIEDARRQWQTARQRPEFFDAGQLAALDRRTGAQQELPTSDLRSLTSESFWERIEERIYTALRDYAERAENGGGFQRRLFAEDAARGFAFIDVCRNRYDVALMNPPFGEPAAIAKTYIENGAGASKADIYTAFLFRWCSQLNSGGRLGAITPRSFIYQVDFHDFRRNYLLRQGGIPLLVELGFGELDGATNRTAAYLLVPSGSRRDLTLYANLSDDGYKEGRLQALFSDLSCPELRCARLEDFDTDTSSQLLFRLSPSFRALLSTLPKLDPVLGKAHKGERNGVCNIVNGLQCPSDFRYVRLTVEVGTSELGSRWQLFLKPLEFAPYISELACVVNWHKAGAEQKAEYEGAGISPSKYISGENFYPSGGVWFPDVSERGIGAALIPFMALPGRKGLLAAGKSERDIPSDALAGFLNSIVAEGVLGLTTPERHHKPSYIGQIPWLSDETIVRTSAEHYWRMCGFAAVEASSELGGSFLVPTILLHRMSGLRDTIRTVVNRCDESSQQMEREQMSFDELILRRLKANSTDIALLREMSNRAKIHDWFPTNFSLSQNTEYSLVADLVSYFVGSAYGRWNLQAGCSATVSAQRIAKQHSLERCPPGQLQNAQGLPLEKPEVQRLKAERKWNYSVEIPWDGILVDDPNHPLDIERCVREVIGVIWGERQRPEVGGQRSEGPEGIEHEACEILGVKSLRDYFRKPAGFFADHLKRYSKSRRQAPIYWPISTASGSYTLWIYYHRLTDQTLFQCVNDFVKPKLEEVNRDLERLQKPDVRDQKSAREKLEELQDFAAELREFHDELLRVAGMPYKPDLNDGVLITASPLWALFRLPKWQKDLRSCWSALEDGEYDWAHLAYSIWPERVKEVCKTDRSIAIAHGREDLCDVKVPEKKAKRRKKGDQMELPSDE